VPFVLTIHDLIFLDTPLRGRRFRQSIGHRYLRWNVPRAARHAAAVATVSRTSAHNLRHRFDLRVSDVIPHGSDFSPDVSEETPAFDFAVAFSALDPRKGLELAYRGWVAAGRIPAQLKVLGGAGVSQRFRMLAGDDLRSGRVVILPYLRREDLYETLRCAGVLIYSSTTEGFGLPVLEAMAAGTPVISGLAPVTLEVGGDAVARIDPADPVASIARLLKRMQLDRDWRAQLRAAGLRRARAFSWPKAGQRYLALYELTLDATHQTDAAGSPR
jgi:glycosyltransferase involved in cell wall biosynthesis